METKDELLIYKSALEKLLREIEVEKFLFFSGLRSMAKYKLNRKQRDIFMLHLGNYAISKNVDIDHEYIWKQKDTTPRKQWLESELEKVNLKLKEYEN